MKLHIGCGERFLPGYKHLDARKLPHVDYITSELHNLSMFNDNSVDEIYACHLLEHIPRSRLRTGSIVTGGRGILNKNVAAGETEVLKEWYRILKKDGILRLAVPDFEAVVDEYLASRNLDKLLSLLHGGHKYEQDFHYQSFDFKRLSNLLESIGFHDVKRYEWRDFLPPDYDDYSRCYLPHMDFENGRLMSLNVVAKK